MKKVKIYIITLSLLIITLLINITPVYCASYNYYIWFRANTTENFNSYTSETLSLIIKDSEGNIKNKISYEATSSSKAFVWRYNLDNTITYTYELYVNDYLILSDSFMPSSNSYIYIDLLEYSSIEFPEEITPTPSETPEDTETSGDNIIIGDFDDTNINNNLLLINNSISDLNIKLDIFISIFVFYFAYKVIKEIVNKFERMD